MVYILGGASRSGKSIIARRLVIEQNIPFFCTDFLVTSLSGINTVNIQHDTPFIEKADKLWPLVKPMLNHLVKEEPQYLIEGDGILPKNVFEFQKDHNHNIRVCFVGFSEIEPSEKLHQIREMGGNMDDWTKRFSDAELIKYVEKMIVYSKYLKKECEKFNVRYFDSSKNFDKYVDEVYSYIVNK